MIGGPHEIDERVYRKDSGINISTLKELRYSPLRARHREMTPVTPTAAMELGTAIHAAILEPDKFFETYGEKPSGGKRTKVGKELEAEAEKSGKKLLPSKTFADVVTIAERFKASPLGEYLDEALFESSWFYDHEFGRRTKARLDIWQPKSRVIADIKTTQSCDDFEFAREVYKRRYDAQAAYYADIVTAVTGSPVERCLILAIESSEPFDMRIFEITPEYLELGRRDYRRWLARYVRCEATQSWPGYSGEVFTLEPPKWLDNEDAF